MKAELSCCSLFVLMKVVVKHRSVIFTAFSIELEFFLEKGQKRWRDDVNFNFFSEKKTFIFLCSDILPLCPSQFQSSSDVTTTTLKKTKQWLFPCNFFKVKFIKYFTNKNCLYWVNFGVYLKNKIGVSQVKY